MIQTTSVTVGIPVGDLADATAWYGRLLEAEPDIEPVEGILEYEVRDGFWLQISEGERGSGEAVIRFGVRDIEAARGRLIEAGIEVGDVERIDGLIALLDFVDPWRNNLGFYQVLSRSG
jgi:hypothetical protein